MAVSSDQYKKHRFEVIFIQFCVLTDRNRDSASYEDGWVVEVHSRDCTTL